MKITESISITVELPSVTIKIDCDRYHFNQTISLISKLHLDQGILAIQLLRHIHKVRLYEAKKIVDYVFDNKAKFQ